MFIKISTTITAVLACTLGVMAPATAATRTPPRLHATSATSTTITLNWGAVAGAKVYRIMSSTRIGMRQPTYHRFTSTTGTLRHLRPSQRYYFRAAVLDPRTGRRISAYTPRKFPTFVTKAVSMTKLVPPPTPTSNAPYDLRVGSYNVQSLTLDRTVGNQRPWRQRRAGVIANILGENVDVIGIQEANQSNSFANRVVDGPNQFMDLRNGLNRAGGSFEVTTSASYNCADPSSSYKCRYRNWGAGGGDHILYNTKTLTMLSHGAVRYASAKTTGTLARYLTYAKFQVNSTGRRFLFTSTHLDKDRATEWREVVQQVNRLKGSLPVVNVGDYNTQKYDTLASRMLPGMKNAGYGDVLNQQYKTNPVKYPRAQSTVNGHLYSFNHDYRDVRRFSCDVKTKIGNNIDWVFATNSLAVREWKVVANYNPATMQLNGVIPSDHNMIRATITLPLRPLPRRGLRALPRQGSLSGGHTATPD
jgi:endonuclease/exonuclease/phosphatase family metal-dependent hydrolase